MTAMLGRYRLVDRIGSGGLGDVYKGIDTQYGRTVAVKVLPRSIADHTSKRAELHREGQAIAALSHPNIATLYEIGESDGRLFVVFDYVAGQTLAAHLGGRPLNPRHAVEIAAQLADALADGHGRGLVHGDVRPANVIVTAKGHPQLLDFGLSAWTTGGTARRLNASAPFDELDDVFCLGAVFYEMVTGRSPFPSTARVLPQSIRDGSLRPPSVSNPAVPVDVDRIVEHTLAPRDRRFDSAAVLAAELRALAAVLDARLETIGPRSLPVSRRGKRPAASGASMPWFVALAFLLGGLAAAVWLRLLR
jgi:serine/threonine protein kinase